MDIMNYNRLGIAVEIAFMAHKDQRTKDGEPYVYHPLEIMSKVKGFGCKIVAILHDVVKDTDYTLEDIWEHLELEVNHEIIEAIDLLTHKAFWSYEEYINKIANSGNQLAIKVKIEDLKHNMDLSRIPKENIDFLYKITNKITNKYKPSLIKLKDVKGL